MDHSEPTGLEFVVISGIINHLPVLQLIITVSVVIAASVFLLGIGIFAFGRKFPETEVGKNKHMMKLGLRCPHCEERDRYKKPKAAAVNLKNMRPDWSILNA